MASAQTTPQGGMSESQPGMSSPSGGQAPQTQQQRGGESQRGIQEQRGEGRDGIRAQQTQQSDQQKDRTSGQAQRDSEPRRDAQPKQQSDQQKDRTSGQAQRDSESRRDAQTKQQSDQQKDRTQDRAGAQDRDRGNQDKAAARPDENGRVTLNTEQRTRIQKTVFARSNLPRVSRVDFALHVGTVIPTHVAIVDVPPALIEINPSWRSHKFFVVEEDIIVVSPERKIVAVVPVGRDRASGAGASAMAVALPPEEIRIVQQVLIDRGFDVELDGVFGTRTRQALIAFQRREGLQATGSIDTRTVAKLGVQDRVKVKDDGGKATSGQASRQQEPQQRETSGQARDAKQQPQQRESSGQGSSAQQQPQQRESSGQGSGDAKQSQQRETSGQGSSAQQQPQQRETSGQGSSDAKQQSQASGSADRSAEQQRRPGAGESPSSSGGSSRY
jgi:peptidoglycan hydrolase-like protein with peptidoglycan-binding domain